MSMPSRAVDPRWRSSRSCRPAAPPAAYRERKSPGSSAASATISASSSAPAPPSTTCVADRGPRAGLGRDRADRPRARSGGRSGNALMATTGETPNARTFSICLRRLAPPTMTSSGFSSSSSGGSGLPGRMSCRPLCALSDRTVATSTAASGTRPDTRHFTLKNRSAPMSAPNPASVTRKSPIRMPTWSATTEELPVAMLPNGPACTRTGPCSSVCRRLGLTASRMSDGHRAAGLELLGGDRLAVVGVADDDATQPLAHVLQRRREGQDHHHLAGRGDVEPGLPRHAVGARAEPDHDVAQRAVVDVQHASPGDRARVDAELVAVVQVVVDHRGEHVVRRRDGVEVAGEVQVERAPSARPGCSRRRRRRP